MNIDSKLSRYRELSDLGGKSTAKLIKHTETDKLFVLKLMKVYDIDVYRYLSKNPVTGVPNVEEFFEDDGLLYVIEEYISGETLRSVLSKGVLSEERAADYTKQLCAILSTLHAHTPAIVHRDIKPENIIIAPDNRLFLIDFNSAKESGAEESRDTVLIGTVGYAAPEQYGFSSSKPASDIYAIGVTLNEMLTGHIPSAGIHRGKLEEVIKKCTRMDPEDRYMSVDELSRAISINITAAGRLLVGIRKWLPPGIRSGNALRVIVGVMWYAGFTALSLTLNVKNAVGAEITMNRITCFAIFLLETLWIGNYRDIWNVMPLAKNKKTPVKVTGIAMWAIVFALSPIILLTLFMNSPK